LFQQQVLSASSSADGLAHPSGAVRAKRQMAADLEMHARMKTMGLNVTTLTIFINEDSLATIECQLDTLERLIAKYGAHAF
jgi:hypothetical protein